MPDRPTLTYDGTHPDTRKPLVWRDFMKGVPEAGAELIVKAREAPYLEPFEVRTSGYVIVKFEKGAILREQARLIQNTPNQTDPYGTVEWHDLVQLGVGGDAVSLIRGHRLLKNCLIDGTGGGAANPDVGYQGGNSGISSSHSRGKLSFDIWDNCKARRRGSHITYGGETTAQIIIGGLYEEARPGMDAQRALGRTVLMFDVHMRTWDPADPLFRSSMLHGGLACGFTWMEGCTLERFGTATESSIMAAQRCRQSIGGANMRWIGNAPTAQPVRDLPGWEWFGPWLMDDGGEYLRPLTPDPRHEDSAYWQAVRDAGIDTPEQLARNPHTFKHVYLDNEFISHGPGAIAILNEGTAVVAPKTAREIDERRGGKPIGQDDYLPLPPKWVERSVILARGNQFTSDGDAAEPLIRFRGRRASAWVVGKSQSAWVDLAGNEGPGDGTLARVLEVSAEALPARFALPGLDKVFPAYARYAGPAPVDPVERRIAKRRIATEQRRLVDRS